MIIVFLTDTMLQEVLLVKLCIHVICRQLNRHGLIGGRKHCLPLGNTGEQWERIGPTQARRK